MGSSERLEAALLRWTPPSQSASKLDLYLEELRSKFNLDPDFRDADWQRYVEYLNRHFARIVRFLDDEDGDLQNLVLGNVQSGKTGHLMANICWAFDQGFSLVILLSGTKNTLDEQTSHRLKSLSQGFSVIPTPTKSDAKVFSEFCLGIKDSVRARNKDAQANLGIITLIKQQDRLEAVAQALEGLSAQQKSRILIIDDEADQASPDGETNFPQSKQRKDRTIHKLLSRLVRVAPARTVYLSYTATPQAILHQDLDSLLQPRYCSVVPSGPSYFGLHELLNEDSALGAIEDIMVPSSRKLESDEQEVAVLESAFVEFLVLAWLHKFHPSSFHNFAGSCGMGSVQMLVHPSGKQEDHGRFKSQIDRTRRDILIELQAKNQEFLRSEIIPIFKSVTERLEESVRSDIFEEFGHFLTYLLKLLQEENLLAVKLINSTERSRLKQINKEKDFIPVSDSDWLKADAWVLIGGDILGRGLTIPHLVSTFFLRFSKSPNFDTSVQQMRFCGYRSSYKHLLKVYAPQIVVNDYRAADVIDSHARDLADHWDVSSRDLLQNPPPIRFASPEDARFSPTRRNVMSLAIRSARLGGSSPMFALARISSRKMFGNNVSLLKRITEPSSGTASIKGSVSFELSPSGLRRLLREWDASESETDFRAFADLLDIGLSGNNLKQRTIRLVVPESILLQTTSSLEQLNLLGTQLDKRDELRSRSLNDEAAKFSPNAWLDDEAEIASTNLKAVVGDSERSVRDSFPGEVVLQAQIFTLVSGPSRTVLGQGVSLIGWAPITGARALVHGSAIR